MPYWLKSDSSFFLALFLRPLISAMFSAASSSISKGGMLADISSSSFFSFNNSSYFSLYSFNSLISFINLFSLSESFCLSFFSYLLIVFFASDIIDIYLFISSSFLFNFFY